MHDGTILQGWELVTQPLSREYILQTDIIERIGELENIGGMASTVDPETSGMHVHISKKSFTSRGLYNFIYFFHTFVEFLLYVSQRSWSPYSIWCPRFTIG